MGIINVLALHLGSPASIKVEDKKLSFYRDIASAIMGKAYKISQPDNLYTINFDGKSIVEKSPEIYARILDRAEAWTVKSNLVIVDATSFVNQSIERGGVMIHVAHAISFIEQNQKDIELIILLVQQTPPVEDVILNPLKDLLTSKKLLIIGDDGSYYPDSSPTRNFDQDVYRIKLQSIKDLPFEKQIERKLIRRLGHFKRDPQSNGLNSGKSNSDESCARYSYDAHLSLDAIEACLKNFIKDNFKFTEGLQILYRCPEKHWLEGPVLAVGLDLDVKTNSIIEINQLLASGGITADKQFLLVLPMIDTGFSLIETLNFLAANSIQNIKILSILATDQSLGGERRREFSFNGTNVTADYIVKVSQRRYASDDCPMCRLNIPKMDYYNDEYLSLTTYDFWEMASQFGWKREEDTPENREQIELVPDFPAVIKSNGIWLGSKIWQKLEFTYKSLPANPVIVCPDEKGARILATYLSDVHAATSVIFVPRKVLNSFAAPDYARNTSGFESSESWFQSLLSATSNDLILLDEFNYSGGTLAAMIRLLNQCGKHPLCYFSIVDFAADANPFYKIDVLSLYAFQANSLN